MNANLLTGMAELGHRVMALAPITDESLSEGDDFALSRPAIGITRYEIPYWAYWPTTAEAADYRTREREQLERRFPELIAAFHPDLVVMGHESFAWDIPDLARAARLPSVLMVHSGATVRLFGTALGRRLLEQFRKTDLVITVAEHLATELRRSGVSRVSVIPNAVDLDRFSPRPREPSLQRELNIGESAIVVMHASNLKPIKRPLDFIHAACSAAAQDPRLVCVVGGDGPMRAAMENACQDAKLMERFRFVGWVDHRRVPEYLNLADVVVMPSEAEGQALVYLEAQACARLLIASDIPAAREVVSGGKTGILFRTADVEDLTTKILLAAGDPELRAAIGRRAREGVQPHSLTQAVASYETCFESVASQSDHRRPHRQRHDGE
jgi:glycosyltransferase involved in cell wall biosynthesis